MRIKYFILTAFLALALAAPVHASNVDYAPGTSDDPSYTDNGKDDSTTTTEDNTGEEEFVPPVSFHARFFFVRAPDPTPLPAALPMFAAGIMLVGAMAYRRRSI